MVLQLAGENSDTYAEDKFTILEAFQNKVGKENILYTGADLEIEDQTAIEKTVELAKDASKIILCLGELHKTPGDISNLYISTSQIKLALALSKLNKPIILVLNEGRPRLISDFEDKMSAVINVIYQVTKGRALVDIVYERKPKWKTAYN
jgi:beta-glucosidase